MTIQKGGRTKIVNRGGLFEVNDSSFALFKEIESTLQLKLEKCLSCNTPSDQRRMKYKIISEVTHDNDVLYYWSLLTVDITNEDESMELLHHIVELWTTIQGFSLANEWLEQYKCKEKKSSAKNKGLRKTLKQKSASELI